LSIAVVAAALLIASTARRSWSDPDFDYFNVSIPTVTMAPGESIYGISIETESAVILRTKVPLAWDLNVDNSEGERSALKAGAIVGAAALNEGGAGYFHDFLEVARYKHPSILTRFGMIVTLSITNNRTGAERKIRLPLKQMVLKPSTAP
jgi:hypothetical protein